MLMITSNAFADEFDDPVMNLKEPVNFEVDLLLNNVVDIDRTNGHYVVDFWLVISSDDINFTEIPPPDIDFTNGIIDSVSSVYVTEHFIEQRIQGKFFNKFDFRNFPFDVIDLKIIVEPVRPWTIEKAILHVSPTSGIDPDANVPGYVIGNKKFDIETHTYELDNEVYPRFVANFSVEKSSLGSFLKVMFPVLIVLGISFVAYIVPEHYEVSAAIALLPLVAVIFLHINILDQLPSLAYLTIFDKMMIIVYAMIANNVVSTGRQMREQTFRPENKSWLINNMHLKLSPIIAVILGVILFVLL